jgi:hypothetical protein
MNLPANLIILDATDYDALYQQSLRELKRQSDPDKIVRRAFPAAARKTAAWMADKFTDYVMKDDNIKQALVDYQLRGALGLRHSQDIKAAIFKKSKAFFKVNMISSANGKYEIRFVNENAMADVAKQIYYVSKRSYLSPFTSKRTKNAKPQKINWFEWLLRPSTGKITGYSVWPGPNDNRKLSTRLAAREDLPIEFLQQTLEDAIKTRSRSGTHIMLFGGNFSIKSWVKRTNDINIDKEFINTYAQQARDYFRVALIEQVSRQGISKNVTTASGGAPIQLIPSKNTRLDEGSALRQEQVQRDLAAVIARVLAKGDLKEIAALKALAKKSGVKLKI